MIRSLSEIITTLFKFIKKSEYVVVYIESFKTLLQSLSFLN